MTSYEPLAYFQVIKFWILYNLENIWIFWWGFQRSVSLITGFSISRSLKKVFLKIHKTFNIYSYVFFHSKREKNTQIWHFRNISFNVYIINKT